MNHHQEKTSITLLQGALILTIAALLSKILSAVYRVPFQNIVGDVGFYIYQQVYPFYGVAILLSTSGFPIMISKLIHDRSIGQSRNYTTKVLQVSMLFLVMTCFLCFLVLFGGSVQIAKWMGDEKLSILIQIISFSFLMIPLVSIMRGYFQSQHIMQPSAISQVVEQLIRVVTILLLSYLFVSSGYDLYVAGAGAVFGSLLGSVAALFILLVFLQKRRVKWKSLLFEDVSKEEIFLILKRLVKYSVTICFTSLLIVFMQMVDSFHLYRILLENNWSEYDAKVLKGVYDRGQPLLQLGTIVATSIALSLVPAIAKGEGDVQKQILISYKVCLALSVAATAGMISIIEPLNTMLFSNNSGTNVLAVYCLSILFCSVAITTGAILQGLDKAEIPAITVLLGLGIKWLLNEYLIPHYDTMGAAIATVLAYAFIAFLNVFFIRKQSYTLLLFSDVLKMGTVAFGMVISLKLYQKIFFVDVLNDSRFQSLIEVFTSVGIGAIIYVSGLYTLNIFYKEEWSLLIGKKNNK